MNAEDHVTQQVQGIQALAEKHKGINTTMLALNALAQAQQEETDAAQVRKAYWVSVMLPPLGLLYALYFLVRGKAGGGRVARNCALFTGASVLLVWGMGAVLSSAFTQEQSTQIQSVTPADVKQLRQGLLE
jgi:hypothetical protein